MSQITIRLQRKLQELKSEGSQVDTRYRELKALDEESSHMEECSYMESQFRYNEWTKIEYKVLAKTP